MQQEAELHKAEDDAKKEAAEAKNIADSLIHTAEKSLKDAEGKIGEDIKTDVQAKIDALKTKKDSGTSDEIKKLSEELSTSMQKIGEEMMKQAPQDTTAPEAPQAEAEGEQKSE
jgi:molecular chaperone DnaK